jgi:hypothetical protein
MSTKSKNKNKKSETNEFIKEKMKNSSKGATSKKQKSLEDSQGVSDFSGGSNNAPADVDRKTRNSNMNQTNF